MFRLNHKRSFGAASPPDKRRRDTINNPRNPVVVKPGTGENSSVKINEVTSREGSVIMLNSNFYKVFHLDETTSIILKRCPVLDKLDHLIKKVPEEIDPRKIYFEGTPANVIIDERTTVNLEFDGKWKKFQSANGYNQQIKFGTPDREIYLNDQTIKARFGGPSVACRLNGDNKLHSIRLENPKPTIRVSEDQRVDLWFKYIKKVHTMESSNRASNNAPLELTKAKIDCDQPHSTRTDKNDDPKVCTDLDKKKRGDPDEIPLELELESMRLKRDYLIERRYSGGQCTTCGQRFENKDKFSSHLDWHFRNKRRARENANKPDMCSRLWYYPLDQWLEFKEIVLETNDSKTDKPPQPPEIKEEPPRVKANSNDTRNICSVCYEKFEQIWCDNDECWMLENAKLVDGHYFHPTCPTGEPAKVITSEENDDEISTG